MIARIRQFLAPPTFEDEEKTRVARLLNTALLTFLAVILVVIVVTLAFSGLPSTFDDAFTLLSSVTMVVIIGGLLVLARRGHLQIPSVALLSLTWAIITFWIIGTAGIRSDSSTLNYVMIVVLAGLLLGGRGAMAFTLLSTLAVLSGYYVEANGILVIVERPLTIMDPILTMVPLVLTGLLLRHAVNSMLEALERARTNERAQVEANSKLQEIRASLEQRVDDRTRDLARRSMHLQAAAEVGRTAASIHDLDELLSQVTKLISERFVLYHVGIFLLDQAGGHAVLRAANSEGGQRMLAEGYKVKVDQQSTVGYVTSTQQAHIAQDAGDPTEAVRPDNPFLPHTRSEMALPLIAGGRLLGALNLQSMERAAFTTEDVVVLQVLADQVAVAIENARLFADSQAALRAAQQAFGEMSREMWQQMFRAQPNLRYVCDSQGIVHPVADQRPPEMTPDLRSGQIVRENPFTVILPIKVRDHVLGAIRLRKPDEAEEWTKEEVTLMQTLAGHLAEVLENARLYTDTQRRAAREQLAAEVTSHMRETLDVDTVLKTAARELRAALDLAEAEVRMGIHPTPGLAARHSPPTKDIADNGGER